VWNLNYLLCIFFFEICPRLSHALTHLTHSLTRSTDSLTSFTARLKTTGQVIRNFREALSLCERGKLCCLMLDTKGPEIRTGKLRNEDGVKLIEGESVTLTMDKAHLGECV